jgi:hypothetical protein
MIRKDIYADDPEKTFYDQRASILAILCDAHSDNESKELMAKILDKNTVFDSEANLFYFSTFLRPWRRQGLAILRTAATLERHQWIWGCREPLKSGLSNIRGQRSTPGQPIRFISISVWSPESGPPVRDSIQ